MQKREGGQYHKVLKVLIIVSSMSVLFFLNRQVKPLIFSVLQRIITQRYIKMHLEYQSKTLLKIYVEKLSIFAKKKEK